MAVTIVKHPEPWEQFYVRLRRLPASGACRPSRAAISTSAQMAPSNVCGGCQVLDPLWLDQARRMELRRRRLTPRAERKARGEATPQPTQTYGPLARWNGSPRRTNRPEPRQRWAEFV